MANSSKPGALYDWDVIQKLRTSGLNWTQTAEEMGMLPSTLRSMVRRRRDYLNSLATQEVDMRAMLVGVGIEMMLSAKTQQPKADHEYALKWADFLARISGAYAPSGPSQLSQTNVQLPTQIILMPRTWRSLR